ncbi:gluconokinase, GntK/IdnK-type [Microbacterium sp. LRZ72]|uniref:gluconokinase n=1 Tax=Microbacterium sp. LRZ72 TaxID=2942481 RepID=UPI00299FF288|nr:gluconokinase, GntK/IdnK-type [Microbacterium sp. LRZ72]MDX2376044.1 gluconokinase, GntK/IdnK-type [Microbacterium sp. LRZ72]
MSAVDVATPRIVVMGVSAVGKTTVGIALAETLGVPFLDADDFHDSAAIAKMASGTPLDDDDRSPWLARVGDALTAAPDGAVVACSALARRYRDILRRRAPDVLFVHLDADGDVLRERATTREGHYMPASLLASQLATLEPLGPDEAGIRVDAALPVDEVVAAAAAGIRP